MRAQDGLARRLAQLVCEPEPKSGFPRATLLPLPEGCAVVSDIEVRIDVSVPPEFAVAMLRALVAARPTADDGLAEPHRREPGASA
jgi:hypothetical protein